MKTTREEVAHWLGNSYDDWIADLIYRLLNKKVSVNEIRTEAKQMYKEYKKI